MDINRAGIFCRQWALWLHASPWDYRSALAVSINTVGNLPNNANAIIYDLHNRYSKAPELENITEFLLGHEALETWFLSPAFKPVIQHYELSATDNVINDLRKALDIRPVRLDWFCDRLCQKLGEGSHLQHYSYQLVEKRRGGKRLIEAPKTDLKEIQRWILDNVLPRAKIHPASYGFQPGQSCLQHAKQHIGKHYVFQFDLQNCFLNIQWHQIYGVFHSIGHKPSEAKTLTALASHASKVIPTMSSQLDKDQRRLLKARHLPQGAPCSPMLCNAVLYFLDRRLSGLAESLNLEYSRYADDLVFSGNQHRNWRFLEPLIGSICLEQGFPLNHRKTRLSLSHQKQKVTGIVVNQKVNVDRKDYEQLKAILYNCVKQGIDSQNKGQHPDFKAHLKGRIDYVSSLNENKGSKLYDLFSLIV